MKNVKTCNNCNSENAFYNLNCTSCGSYLRERVVNIDLWKVIWMSFDAPVKALKDVIFAEHKNLTSAILFFVIIKLFLISIFLENIYPGNILLVNSFVPSLLIFILLIIPLLFAVAKLLNILLKWLKVQTRTKDIISVITYSFTPLIFSLFILTTIEFALFGKYWFFHNPSPFLLKTNAAYLISGIEGILIFWSFINLTAGMYAFSKNKIFSAVSALAVYAIIYYTMINGLFTSAILLILK